MNKLINKNLFDRLITDAGQSPRKRSHYNLHSSLEEPVQRLCIGLVPGTYVRPHKHPENNKWEMMLVLKGSVVLLIFDSTGQVTERMELSAGELQNGIELPPDTWHTLFPQGESAVILEVKEGPYNPAAPTHFADWAPEETAPETAGFLEWAQAATIGESYSDEDLN